MAAVLAAGPGALLSHSTAAALWGLRVDRRTDGIEVTVPPDRGPRPGLRVHRRGSLAATDRTQKDGIPVTSPVRTLIDLGTVLAADALEAAVNEADKLDLVDPDRLRAAVQARLGRPGVETLRRILDRPTFALTDSELERRFLRLVRRAGVPQPRTGAYVNGCKVDFYWEELGLVIETDGLRYHRTAAQQSKDRERDQRHTAAGLTTLRFTHAQIAYEADRVAVTLVAVFERLRSARLAG